MTNSYNKYTRKHLETRGENQQTDLGSKRMKTKLLHFMTLFKIKKGETL